MSIARLCDVCGRPMPAKGGEPEWFDLSVLEGGEPLFEGEDVCDGCRESFRKMLSEFRKSGGKWEEPAPRDAGERPPEPEEKPENGVEPEDAEDDRHVNGNGTVIPGEAGTRNAPGELSESVVREIPIKMPEHSRLDSPRSFFD